VGQWVADSMIYIQTREGFEQDEPMVVTLYRYLGVLERLLQPMSSGKLAIDSLLFKKLNRAICDKACHYFTLGVNLSSQD
jgi:hypothetical protein